MIQIPIARSGNLSLASTVQMRLNNGSAIAGRDFIGALSTVRFAVGQAIAWLTLSILGNKQYEADKTLTVTIVDANEANAPSHQSSAIVTILNDDPVFQKGKGRSGAKEVKKRSKVKQTKRRK